MLGLSSSPLGATVRACVPVLVQAGLIAALAGAAGAAGAVSVVQNISYNQPNLSPWSAGSAFTLDWQKSIGHEIGFNLPLGDLSVSSLLSSYLKLPEIGFVEASVSGRAGAWLNLGYHVSGGRLNLQYPGRGRLDFGRAEPGRLGTLSTAFAPGLTRTMVSSGQAVATLLGRGYDPNLSLPGFAWDRYQAPVFATSFPTASAWADVHYDLQASIGVTAGVAKIAGECVLSLCARLSAKVSAVDTIPLLAVDKTGVQVLGKAAVPFFDQNFSVGVASVKLAYPNLQVPGVLQADGVTLAGRDARPVITFNAPLEQLVPFIGPALSPKVGPFETTLLSIAGGPSLGIYQDFEVSVKPKVQLDFGTQVQFERNGQRWFDRSITVDLGESVSWKPVLNYSGVVHVRPTWLLDGSISNTTGIAIGAQLSVDALKLNLPPLPTMGPVPVVREDKPDLVSIPLYAPEPFDITRTAVAGAPVDVPMQASFSDRASLSTALLSALKLGDAEAGQSDWALTFGVGFGASFTTQVRGRATGVLVGSVPGTDFQLFDTVLETLAPVRLTMNFEDPAFDAYQGETLDLGSLFCVRCSDRSAALVDQGNFLVDGADRLYMNRLDDIPTDLGVARDPVPLFTPALVTPQVSVTAVPEPGSWLLMAAGLGWLVGHGRRARAVAGPSGAAPGHWMRSGVRPGQCLAQALLAALLLAPALPATAQWVVTPHFWWETTVSGLDGALFSAGTPIGGSLTPPPVVSAYDDGRRSAYSAVASSGSEVRAEAGFGSTGFGMLRGNGFGEGLYGAGSVIVGLALDPNGPGSANVRLLTSGLVTLERTGAAAWPNHVNVLSRVQLTGGFQSPGESGAVQPRNRAGHPGELRPGAGRLVGR